MTILYKEYGQGDSVNPYQVKIARGARGYSQPELADALKLPVSTVSAYEEGWIEMREEILLKYIKLLKFPESFFKNWPACPNCKCTIEGNMPVINSLLSHLSDSETETNRLDRIEEKLDKFLDSITGREER